MGSSYPAGQGFADTTSRVPRIDGSTHCAQTVTYAHHEVHGGSAFFCSYSVADLGAMAAPDDMIQLHFTTPDTTKWLHMIMNAFAGGEALLKVTEAPSGGLANPTGTLTALNRNRNSAKTAGITVSYDGTAATGGSVLREQYIGQGNAGAGESRGIQEWVLKQNTTYAVSLFDTTNITATLMLDWYEHTDRD